jgi:hypothetical protein
LRTGLFLGFVFLFFVRSICAPVLKPPSSVIVAVFWHWLVNSLICCIEAFLGLALGPANSFWFLFIAAKTSVSCFLFL